MDINSCFHKKCHRQWRCRKANTNVVKPAVVMVRSRAISDFQVPLKLKLSASSVVIAVEGHRPSSILMPACYLTGTKDVFYKDPDKCSSFFDQQGSL